MGPECVLQFLFIKNLRFTKSKTSTEAKEKISTDFNFLEF
jgi:hypothetical protein